MAFGDSEDHESVEQTTNQAVDEELYRDECSEEIDGEYCERDLHVRTHERDRTNGAPNHPDAPEVEAVCPTHGVVYKG